MFRALSVATMKRSDVRKLVSAAVAPKVEDVKPTVEDAKPTVEDVKPTVEVVTSAPDVVTSAPVVSGSPDSAFQSWKRTSQWEQNTTLRGINPQRLGSVIQARVEAAFRAGYAAGVGDSI
jgi:hypothetical protein